jgi:hypothetical protein
MMQPPTQKLFERMAMFVYGYHFVTFLVQRGSIFYVITLTFLVVTFLVVTFWVTTTLSLRMVATLT